MESSPPFSLVEYTQNRIPFQKVSCGILHSIAEDGRPTEAARVAGRIPALISQMRLHLQGHALRTLPAVHVIPRHVHLVI